MRLRPTLSCRFRSMPSTNCTVQPEARLTFQCLIDPPRESQEGEKSVRGTRIDVVALLLLLFSRLSRSCWTLTMTSLWAGYITPRCWLPFFLSPFLLLSPISTHEKFPSWKPRMKYPPFLFSYRSNKKEMLSSNFLIPFLWQS